MTSLLRRVRRLFDDGPAPVILMYHRVADLRHDPWELAVTPMHFAQQMALLKSVRRPFLMSEFMARLEGGTLPPEAAAVTFDDGYIDNLTQAEPILRQAGVPATIFLATGQLGQTSEFWWDELARMVLDQSRAVNGDVRIGGQDVAVRLPEVESDASAKSTWRAWDPPESPRQQAYIEIWRRLRDLGVSARADAMRELRDVFAVDRPDPSDLPMSREDVSRLGAGNGIEIGAHSQSHQPLTTLSPDERRQEIDGSRRECEALSGRPVTGFAYPYGDRDADTMAMVRDLGFKWACSTHSAGVDRKRFDRFDLPRLQVLDWNGAAFGHALQNVWCRK